MNKEQTSLHIPPYLKKGDKIGLISTARKISRDEFSQRSWKHGEADEGI